MYDYYLVLQCSISERNKPLKADDAGSLGTSDISQLLGWISTFRVVGRCTFNLMKRKWVSRNKQFLIMALNVCALGPQNLTHVIQ